jgi:glycosyltransferase involved in cell wall biosynthesis
MKIIQLSKYYPPYQGGIELVAKMITKAHVELKDSVDIISFGEEDKKYRGNFSEKVWQIKEQLKLLSTPINFFSVFKIIKKVQNEQYDYIYVHLPNPFMHALCAILKIISPNSKIFAIYHSDIVNQKLLKGIYNLYFLATYFPYNKIIVSSDNLWNNSPVLTKVDSRKKFVLNFCSDSIIEYHPRKSFSGKLVAIGRFVPYKGFDFLVKTINKTKYQLTIIGSGPEFDKIKALADDNIHLVGRVSDEEKTKILNDSDILIMSSINTSEAYGMVLVEAFAAGLPVIVPNIPSGVTYLGKDNERGHVFEILNQKSLLSKLEQLDNSPEKLEDFSRNCFNFYNEKLSFEAFKGRIQSLCSNL